MTCDDPPRGPPGDVSNTDADPDRAAILARRKHFFTIALSGLTSGIGCAPCLKVGIPSGGYTTSGSPVTTDPETTSSTVHTATGTTQPTGEVTVTDTGATTGCTPDPVCGNGVVECGEECDDGESPDDQTNCVDCARNYYYVFVTSVDSEQLSQGVDGLTAADTLCQTLATNVVPGKYRAWLSGAGTDARDRITTANPDRPFLMPESTPIAMSRTDLLDGTLLAPLNVTETAETLASGATCVDNLVWTGTHPDGSGDPQYDCMDWQDLHGPSMGRAGAHGATDTAWTSACEIPCTSIARFYCFEFDEP